ncbi:MAG: PTS sugar transporter subunit IIA [Elusimicrobia bacterium]|nr:PTS sugar transporter subunit IIA [Elusimicrobiota bacterium]
MSAWLKREEASGWPGASRSEPTLVSPYLSEGAILLLREPQERFQVMEALVRLGCQAHSLDGWSDFLSKIKDREKGISTTLDTGLSLPHARIDDLDRIVSALALLPQGLKEPDQGVMVKAMFLFVSPNKQPFFPLHLRLLRAVSLLFQPALIDELARAQSPAEALTLIRLSEGRGR